MSSTTTNLGLTKPAYADEADIAVINGNMDLLDAAYGAINQSTMRPVPFAIAVSDWEAVTGGFSATYNSAYITTTSQEILTYTKSIENATAHIDAEKKSGGGGLVFTSAKKPTGTVQGTAYVFDNDDRTLPVIIEGTVTPIANGGTGQSSLAGAQSALGITALSKQIEKVDGRVYKITIAGNSTILLNSTADHQIVLLLGFLGGVGCVAILVRKFTTNIDSAKNLLTFSNWDSSSGLSFSVEDRHIKITSTRSATSAFTVITGMS